MERKIVNPWTWQDQYGFVQAVETSGAARTLICSGQTAFDGEGRPQHAGDMGGQLGLALDNLETVLAKADFALCDVVRLTIYTTDVDALLKEFGGMAKRLTESKCRAAQTLLGVAGLASPELMVEIEATAMK